MLKEEIYRSEPHRRAVAELPCCHCGYESGEQYSSQAAHVGGLAEDKGGALKTSDAMTIPLCPDRPGVVGCHTKFDLHLVPFQDRMNALEWAVRMLAATYVKLVERGLLKVRK